MLSSRYRPWHIPLFLGKYAWLRMRRRPVLVNFEVTMRCNARCGFCDYWKTPAATKANELTSFAAAAIQTARQTSQLQRIPMKNAFSKVSPVL